MTNQENPYSSEDIYTTNTGVADSILNKIKRISTSSLLFIATYLIAYTVSHYFTAVLLISFNYKPEITFNDFHNLPFHYSYWTNEKITIIYSGGPLLCLLLGVVFILAFNNIKTSALKLFTFWLSICFCNLFLGFIFFCPFGIGRYDSELYKGFAIVASWWRIGGFIFIPLALGSVFLSIILGYFLRNELLKFSFSARLSNSIKGKNILVRQFYLFPVIIASPVIVSLSTYESIQIHFFLFINLMIISIGAFLRNEYDFTTKIKARKEDVLNKLPLVELIFVAVIYAGIFFYLK
jgi:hypothetical protein